MGLRSIQKDYWDFYTTGSEQQEGLAIRYRQSHSLSPMISRVTLQDVGSSYFSKQFHNQKINKKKALSATALFWRMSSCSSQSTLFIFLFSLSLTHCSVKILASSLPSTCSSQSSQTAELIFWGGLGQGLVLKISVYNQRNPIIFLREKDYRISQTQKESMSTKCLSSIKDEYLEKPVRVYK